MVTLELEEKIKKALEFSYDFYTKNNRFPKTSEDPFYRSASRYFDGPRNYRIQVLVQHGLTEIEAENELDKNPVSKDELFQNALTRFNTKGILPRGGSDLVNEYFGCLFYFRKALLQELGYSIEDILYTIKEQIMETAIPLEEVIEPLESYIRETGDIPKSYELEDRGNIVRRFVKWDIAVDVALEHLENTSVSVDEIYRKHRPCYLPNSETLEPVMSFIKTNNRLPRAKDVASYSKIVREYILWDNALDVAMLELGCDLEKRKQLFRYR